MEKQFVTYPIAKLLKELGFNEKCFGYYSNWGTQEPFLLSCEYGNEKESCQIRRKNFLCSAPLWQQVIDWLRQERYLIQIIEEPMKFRESEPLYTVKQMGSNGIGGLNKEQAIVKALEIIKEYYS